MRNHRYKYYPDITLFNDITENRVTSVKDIYRYEGKVVELAGLCRGLEHTAFNDQHFRRFLQRHSTLSIRVTHANNRKKDREWTHELADKYISKLTELLFHRGFLDEPEQVWNLDESAYNTAEMFDRVLGRKGMRQIYSQFDGTEKELVTILPCGNAAGLQLPFMALFSGKRRVRSRLDGTIGHSYQVVNDSGTMDQLHFANHRKLVVFPAMTKLKVTKDNLLSHLVKLWFYTEECLSQHSFNAGQNLASGFRKSGLFPFSPEVIRATVKTRHCPSDRVIPGEVAAKDYQPIFERLTESLSAELDIVDQKDRDDILKFTRLKQRGVTPGAVLAASHQASLFTVAPKKARREKNDHLNLSAGGLFNEDNFQFAQAAKRTAVKAAKDASKAVKRKSTSNQEEVQETSSILHKTGKSVAVRKQLDEAKSIIDPRARRHCPRSSTKTDACCQETKDSLRDNRPYDLKRVPLLISILTSILFVVLNNH
ncbi:hypothetical protein RvY_18165 [Ramazzottius varieornatus]|uniref:DDE-1 domain-containing protein n=1 Tax=Ramazzottius varieornatus TaxID=947166 RepID=A0A1D1W4R2_RAMVA|nr:hypothetical protein RvY_18165 [Ramazzottius varieornatus]